MYVQERYTPVPVAANTSVEIGGQGLGGFLCSVSGTITIVRNNGGGNTTTLMSAMPVIAGAYYPLPFFLGSFGGTFTTAGGAVGLIGVS
jgi:hypothetical protein